ncbi:LysE family translocator [Akkermansiaceae bacterium]|jgi:threonine/homoserine/homoserine lactone efflux protein|nr:LysE family translocator [Akkermansiaceae bacterium]MDB4809165.1 LysE family translocator [bacterium]MDA7929964.1 LysE family translocator [Akkermansiaceae bacterium]MDA7933878.1 LysE family translocator [Akkermansiaceae bacterium]MDA9830459.1 LysE family translocator [Akkermansiaceae bacterium]
MNGELWAFAVIMVIGQFSPGPDMLLLTRTSLAEGLRAGWMMVLGISTGLTVHATLAIGGIAVVLARGGIVATSLKWLAALYLLWLAFGLSKKPVLGGEVTIPKRSPYLRGLFCNLLNPKALVFFASVVATFLTGPRPDWWPLALWLIVVGEALFFWCLWVWLLQIPKVRAGYQRFGRIIDLLFAVALTGLAMHLLFW